MEHGLAGPIHVTAPDEELVLPEDEFYLVFEDIFLDTGTQINTFDIEHPLDIWEYQLNGRLGNVLLINGNLNPRITWDLQRPMLMHLWNISNARTLRLGSTGNTLYQVGAARGALNGVQAWDEIPLIFVTPELADSGIIEEGVILGHGDVDARPSVLSDPAEDKGMILSAGQRVSFVWTPKPTEDNKAYLEWHDSLNGTYHAFLDDAGVTYKVGYGDGWRAPRYLLTTKFTSNDAQKSWSPTTDYMTPAENNDAEHFVIRIRDELTDGGIPEGFEVEIHEQPSAFSNGTYMLRVENYTRSTQTLQFTGATLEMYRMSQEDGTQHLIPAGNIGMTDTISVIQREDTNAFAATDLLLHIKDVESLQISKCHFGPRFKLRVLNYF